MVPRVVQKVAAAARSIWIDTAPSLVSAIPCHAFRLWAFRALGAKIGCQASIHLGCSFYQIQSLDVADNTVINQRVVLDARSGLTIGSNVSISEQAMIYTLQHDLDSPDFVVAGGPVVIEDYVFVGPRAIILPGTRLGKGCVVAAGAVVTADVEPYAVVAGVPARKVRLRSRDLSYKLDYRRSLH